jgi:predicted phage tail protein
MNQIKKIAAGATLIGALLGGGALAVTALPANAATTTASSTASSSTSGTDTPQTARDETKGGHVGSNGVTEVLLTGDIAAKVKAAALAANPGATIERVENDAEGATYEAHIVKVDGTSATVKLDAAFKVTATETGGPGH